MWVAVLECPTIFINVDGSDYATTALCGQYCNLNCFDNVNCGRLDMVVRKKQYNYSAHICMDYDAECYKPRDYLRTDTKSHARGSDSCLHSVSCNGIDYFTNQTPPERKSIVLGLAIDLKFQTNIALELVQGYSRNKRNFLRTAFMQKNPHFRIYRRTTCPSI